MKKGKMSKADKIKAFKAFAPYLWTLGCFLYLAVYLAERSERLLDSDMSSELVLSNILARDGGILTDKWFYSTELRVLNTQIIFSWLFRITGDWSVVRYVGTLIQHIFLSGSAMYLCYHLNIKKAMPYVAGAVLLPISNQYFRIVLYGVFYVPHIVISFVFIGMLFAMLNCRRVYSKIIYSVLLCLLAFGAGLGGLRQLCILFIPLFLSVFLAIFLKRKEAAESLPALTEKGISFIRRLRIFFADKYMLFAFVSVISVIFSLAGYLVNSEVLYKQYSFKKYDNLNFTTFTFDKFIQIINGFLDIMGYTGGKNIISVDTLSNMAALLLAAFVVYAIYKVFKGREEYSVPQLIAVLITVTAVLVNIVLYTFTDFGFDIRYLIPVAAYFFISSAIYVGKAQWNKVLKRTVCIALSLLLCLTASRVYNENKDADYLEHAVDISEKLMERGYYEGYATFWNANVITEITDGQMEIRGWNDWAEDIKGLNEHYQWLSLKEYSERRPEGRFFLLFTHEEAERYSVAKNIHVSYRVASNGKYVAYGFEDQNQYSRRQRNRVSE